MIALKVNGLKFLCENGVEEWRARTAFTKEPGTVDWLHRVLRHGDLFVDVGANVGVYTLMAARLVGPTGHVTAFEPHVGTALALMRNIEANGFQGWVSVYTCALSDHAGVSPFHYSSLKSGSSDHQLSDSPHERATAVVELKLVETLARLAPPTVKAMKIDVDGHELAIVKGMAGLAPPISLQVELQPDQRAKIIEFLRMGGYELALEHYTATGQQQLSAGVPVSDVISNGIFEQVS